MSNVDFFFSLFSYFRELFLKSYAYEFKEISFVHLLAVTRKKFTFFVGIIHLKKIHFLNFFTHIETSYLSFSFFFVLQRLVFLNLIFTKLNNYLLRIFCCNQKLFYQFQSKQAFVEKNNFDIFSLKSRFQTFVSHFFCTSETCF